MIDTIHNQYLYNYYIRGLERSKTFRRLVAIVVMISVLLSNSWLFDQVMAITFRFLERFQVLDILDNLAFFNIRSTLETKVHNLINPIYSTQASQAWKSSPVWISPHCTVTNLLMPRSSTSFQVFINLCGLKNILNIDHNHIICYLVNLNSMVA